MSDAPPPAGPQPVPRRSGPPAIVIILIVMFVLTFVAGVLAAIAIPAFVKYTRRAKAAEAQTNLSAIAHSVEVRFTEQGTLPASIASTPAALAPGCGAQAWPADAPAGWAELQFTPFGPVRYTYSIDTAPDAQSLYVRAAGDLDCDGILGRFEQSVTIVGRGVVIGPLIRTDELE